MDSPLGNLYPTELYLPSKFTDGERDRILLAYERAKYWHRNQRRVAGPKFVIHPIGVAQILIDEFDADADTVVAGLLHDTVEDTEATLDDIENEFGPVVRHLVDCVTDVGRGDGNDPIHDRIERLEATQEKICGCVEGDSRVAIIKVADRWHNLLTCNALRKKNQCRMADEAIQFHTRLCKDAGFENQAKKFEEAAREILKVHAG